MRTILIIVLLLLLLGALPTWPYSAGWGYYPSGGVGLGLLIVIVLLLVGGICRGWRRGVSGCALFRANILDVAEGERRRQFHRASHHESGCGEEHRIAVHIVGHRATVLADESLQRRAIAGRNPARQRIGRRLEADPDAVFRGHPRGQHVELQRAHHADQRRAAVLRAEQLH